MLIFYRITLSLKTVFTVILKLLFVLHYAHIMTYFSLNVAL